MSLLQGGVMQSPFGAPAPQPTVGSLTHSHSHGGLPPTVCDAPLRRMATSCLHCLRCMRPAGGAHCRTMYSSVLLQPSTTVQAPHRRSTSFGGNGFALPGDAADLLRSDLVTSKVGTRPRAVDVSAKTASEFVQVWQGLNSHQTHWHQAWAARSGPQCGFVHAARLQPDLLRCRWSSAG